MAAIEPGAKFTIEYGNGHTLEVTALAGRGQMALSKQVSRAAEAEGLRDIEQMFDAAYQALILSVGQDKAEAMWEDDLDAELAMEIAGKTLGKQALSEDEIKKSESPHSSGAASFAEDAGTIAEEISSVG